MSKSTHTNEAIRAAMDHLIDRATQFDVDALAKMGDEAFFRQRIHIKRGDSRRHGPSD